MFHAFRLRLGAGMLAKEIIFLCSHQACHTPESKFLGWRLATLKRAKDNSYTVDAQEFMTLMRKFTKAKLEDEEPKAT